MRQLREDLRVLVWVAWHILLVSEISTAGDFQLQPHPCHFIIVVDASGSTISSRLKAIAYRSVLRDTVVDRLFLEGFGENIPRFDSSSDLLSLVHFGIVKKDTTPAYMRLHKYSFLRDYVHNVFVRRTDLEPSELKSKIVPSEYYQLTILSWAKQIALWATRPRRSDQVAQRTFFVLIHDGISNEGSFSEEKNMVGRWGDSSDVRRMKGLIREIEDLYEFSDTEGTRQWAWQQKVWIDERGIEEPIFLEVYELVSRERKFWGLQSDQLNPFREVSLDWTKEEGSTPEIMITLHQDDKFLKWVVSGGKVEGYVNIRTHREQHRFLWEESSVLEMPVILSTPLTCDTSFFHIALNLSVVQPDSLLGRRVVHYVYRQSREASLPFRCSVISHLVRGLEFSLLIVFLVITVYVIYFRFYSTHFSIELPGSLRPLRVSRITLREKGTGVSPKQGLEALSLSLPNKLIQQLFYRNATISVSCDSKVNLFWDAQSGKSNTLILPEGKRHVTLYWSEIPKKPTKLQVTLRQGKTSSQVELSYPAGITTSES